MRPSMPITQIPAPEAVRLQRGIGLIEVMVAAMILAISMLGLIAMQLQAVRTSNDSQARVQAVTIAQDLIERMTMNDVALIQGLNGYAMTLSAGSEVSAPGSLPQGCVTGSCNGEATVAFDVGQAAYYAATLLPEGLISGRVAATDSNNLQIFVAWGGTKPVIGSGDDACMTEAADGTLSYNPDANCIMLEATFQ